MTERQVLSTEDVAAFDAYPRAVLALPWRPGAKCLHGHDVDGGPGLHDAG